MATKTNFLELTLPDNGEYVDNWDSVVNSNFEELDDYASELNEDLVGTTGATGSLGGTAGDLLTRLDVGLNADGSLNLENNTNFSDLEKSKIYAEGSGSTGVQRVVQRFDAGDADVVGAHFGEILDRWDNTLSQAELVKGIRLLAKGYNRPATLTVVDSPMQGFAPNCIVEGNVFSGSPFDSPNCLVQSGGFLLLTGGTTSIVANIDGIPFKIEDDYALSALVTDAVTTGGDGAYYAWLSRSASDYNKATFSPGSPSPATADWPYVSIGGYNAGEKAIDPRILAICDSLKNFDADSGSYALPTSGSTTVDSNIFTDTVTAGRDFGEAEIGDLLVITSPESIAGTYAIGSPSPSASGISIVGKFRATVTNTATYYVLRPSMPAFGCSLQSDPILPGRVYIGEFDVTTGGTVIDNVKTYAYGGVYDTGWVGLDSFGWGTLYNHYLGTVPSSMEIWVKNAAAATDGTVEKSPTLLVRIDAVDTQGGGAPVALDARIPAMINQCDKDTFRVNNTDPNSDNFAYTDYSGTDVSDTSASHSIRVILRR